MRDLEANNRACDVLLLLVSWIVVEWFQKISYEG
jgi:hypothetical protein